MKRFYKIPYELTYNFKRDINLKSINRIVTTIEFIIINKCIHTFNIIEQELEGGKNSKV